MQRAFAYQAKAILESDDNVIGLAVAGSWLTDELDEFSDLDLIVVTRQKVSHSKELMLDYAKKMGSFLSGFTGEHVGEPRVLICLYDHPLMHVDIKFLTLDEFHTRIETPHLLLDKNGLLQQALQVSEAKFPYPDYQWIEDRFWIWIHYALLKIGRGEYLEAYDFTAFVRMVVLGPLLHIKNGNLPRGVRKVESSLIAEDLHQLLGTLPSYNRTSLLESLTRTIILYRQLRTELFKYEAIWRQETEEKVMEYFEYIVNQNRTQ
jgi:predicted nucleotidyltransferase